MPSLVVTPPNQEVNEYAGFVEYTVASNTDWTANSDSSWCLVTSSGSGNGKIVANYTVNPFFSPRIATISVGVAGLSAQTVTLTQENSTVSFNEYKTKIIYVYPNPASGQFSIFAEKSKYPVMEVIIVDPTGATILSRICQGESEYHLDLGSSPPGCYLLKITTKTEVIAMKLVIIKK